MPSGRELCTRLPWPRGILPACVPVDHVRLLISWTDMPLSLARCFSSEYTTGVRDCINLDLIQSRQPRGLVFEALSCFTFSVLTEPAPDIFHVTIGAATSRAQPRSKSASEK